MKIYRFVACLSVGNQTKEVSVRIALGCIGISYDDFCKCTYEEFESICKAWHEMTEGQNRDAWERARIIATISIQPHIKKKLTPGQLMPLPWDKKRKSSEARPKSSQRRINENGSWKLRANWATKSISNPLSSYQRIL